jgi:uncharacterized protein (DUF924 family)
MQPEDILGYWFGHEADDESYLTQKYLQEHFRLWWGKQPETDQYIRDHFGDFVARVGKNEFDSWAETPRGRLALIVALDQFTRNMNRTNPKAFEFDAKAVQLTLDGLKKGHDRTLRPIERVFFYLPLEHSEEKEMQTLCLKCMDQLVKDDPRLEQRFATILECATLHNELIQKYGRYPHRNKILGRISSEEEKSFLRNPGNEAFRKHGLAPPPEA